MIKALLIQLLCHSSISVTGQAISRLPQHALKRQLVIYLAQMFLSFRSLSASYMGDAALAESILAIRPDIKALPHMSGTSNAYYTWLKR
jgi:hypothetical protein